MIWNATHHHGVIDPQVIVAALTAAAFLYSRMKVTPVADPRDGNGQPLVAAPVYRIGGGGGGGGGEYAQKTLIQPPAATPPPSVPELLAPPVAPPAVPE